MDKELYETWCLDWPNFPIDIFEKIKDSIRFVYSINLNDINENLKNVKMSTPAGALSFVEATMLSTGGGYMTFLNPPIEYKNSKRFYTNVYLPENMLRIGVEMSRLYNTSIVGPGSIYTLISKKDNVITYALNREITINLDSRIPVLYKELSIEKVQTADSYIYEYSNGYLILEKIDTDIVNALIENKFLNPPSSWSLFINTLKVLRSGRYETLLKTQSAQIELRTRQAQQEAQAIYDTEMRRLSDLITQTKQQVDAELKTASRDLTMLKMQGQNLILQIKSQIRSCN